MDGNGYVGAALDKTNAVLSAPLVGKVDTVHLFLVVGIVIVSSLAWTRIIAHFPKG